VAVSGGVAANSALRQALSDGRWNAYLPSPSRCTDNAVMIALAGRDAWRRGVRNQSGLAPDPSLELTFQD